MRRGKLLIEPVSEGGLFGQVLQAKDGHRGVRGAKNGIERKLATQQELSTKRAGHKVQLAIVHLHRCL